MVVKVCSSGLNLCKELKSETKISVVSGNCDDYTDYLLDTKLSRTENQLATLTKLAAACGLDFSTVKSNDMSDYNKFLNHFLDLNDVSSEYML